VIHAALLEAREDRQLVGTGLVKDAQRKVSRHLSSRVAHEHLAKRLAKALDAGERTHTHGLGQHDKQELAGR
jgi:hypothetical protein